MWATASYNSIVYNDWLTQWLGEALEPYAGYDRRDWPTTPCPCTTSGHLQTLTVC